MTIASQSARNDYLGADSVGPFPYTPKIFAAVDLVITKRSVLGVETTLAYPADYAVTGIGNAAGGTVTLAAALATGEALTIRRVPAIAQTTDLRNHGSYFPETVEDTFDRLVMIDQAQQDALNRALTLPVTMTPGAASGAIPLPEAGKALVWNAAGTAMENRTLDAAAVALPGNGRTVQTLSAYLANNAVFNVQDFGAVGDGVADDTAAIQTTLDRGGIGVLFRPGATYKISSVLTVKTTGQQLYGRGATLRAIGITTSAISIGNTGAGVFIKTDNVVVDGFTFVGQADGTNPSVPYAIGVLGPPTIPYAEGAGCSHIRVRNCTQSGFCFGIAATGANDLSVTDSAFGGNRYCLGLGAGGYSILLQTCFNVRLVNNSFTAAANDRHAIYVSADPNRAFDNNNVCKGLVIANNRIDWTGVGGTTGFEAPIELRSPENITITGNVVKGGYGGIDYDAQNGNGRNVVIANNVFVGQISSGSERACISFARSGGAYLTDTVVITGNTLLPSGPNMYGIVLSAVNNVTVSGNTGKISASIALVELAGSVTHAYLGGNTWDNTSQYVYLVAGAGNTDITWGADQIALSGGGLIFHWISYPTRPRFGFPRTASITANSTGAPVVSSDPYGMIAALASDPSGIVVTFNGSVDTPSPDRILHASQASGIGQLYTRSVVGAAVTLGVLSTAFAPMPANANNYSIALQVAS